MSSKRFLHEVVGTGIDRETGAVGMRNLKITEAGKASAAVRWYLTSQRVDDFLETLFAVLSVVYCVAAAGFAGVLLGNALGS
jgi:hypothetical protein